MMSWGRFEDASLDLTKKVSDERGTIANDTLLLGLTAEVTSTSTKVPLVEAKIDPRTAPLAGRLLYVVVVSPQVVEGTRTMSALFAASFVTNSRRRAREMVPTEPTEKRRKASLYVPPSLRSVWRRVAVPKFVFAFAPDCT
jgi:hypothetical protein